MHDISTNFYKNFKEKNISDKYPLLIIMIDEKQSDILKGRLTVFHDYFGAFIFMELVNFIF